MGLRDKCEGMSIKRCANIKRCVDTKRCADIRRCMDAGRSIWRSRKQDLICACAAVSLYLLTVFLLWPTVVSFLRGYCRVEVDCSMKHVTVEDLEQLAQQEKDGMAGLSDLAGWRFGEAGRAYDPATSRKADTGVAYVWGTMSLAWPAKTLDGSYGQVMGTKDCVVTEGLSYSLYGAVETCGNLLDFGGEIYRVAAVIDEEKEILFLPATEGRVEQAAFLFEGRERVKERLEGLGF